MKSSFDWQQLMNEVIAKKTAFLLVFFVAFTISYAVLAWLDFLPEPVSKLDKIERNELIQSENEAKDSDGKVEGGDIDDTEEDNSLKATTERVVPQTLVIDSLDRTVPILNPTSRNIVDLDEALLNGTVRHPDSATLEQDGTVFILGHSSYLPTVHNKNFQALNGIQNLKWGDIVRLQSDKYEYIYKVDKVYRATAKDTTVPIAGKDQRLVLATCNSFGSIDDRYMVEAKLLKVEIL